MLTLPYNNECFSQKCVELHENPVVTPWWSTIYIVSHRIVLCLPHTTLNSARKPEYNVVSESVC